MTLRDGLLVNSVNSTLMEACQKQVFFFLCTVKQNGSSERITLYFLCAKKTSFEILISHHRLVSIEFFTYVYFILRFEAVIKSCF